MAYLDRLFNRYVAAVHLINDQMVADRLPENAEQK